MLFAYPAGTEVSIAFALPTDYGSPINVIYNSRFKLPQKLYDDIYEDLNQYKGTDYMRNEANPFTSSPYRIPPFYTIKDATYLIVFSLNTTADSILLRYEKLPTTLTAGTDTVTIPNDTYAKSTIPYLATAELLYNR